jgi:DNA-binding beta-propeller fold protein YncE
MGALLAPSRREEGVNQIARHGKWLSIVCVLGSALISSVGTSFADDQAPCRVIGDKVNPRFTALWVADDGIWAADDLNHALILYDRLSGKEKRRIQGLRTGLDFPAAVQADASFKLADGKRGLIWASMNDTADRVTAYAKQDVDSADTSSADLAPAAVIRFNAIRFDGQAIYRGARVYGFHVDEQNDEIVLGFEKGDFIDADGHASLGSVVIVNRGGADFSQLGTGKRWIHGAHTGLANPHGLWIDASHDEIYVASYGHLPQRAPQLPSITVYDRLANGDAAPKRTIAGNRTHLGMPIKVFVDDRNNELVVADDQEGILVFDRLADGDAMPKRMIASHNMPNGVFVDNAHDELVVANWEHRSIEFYPRNWNGPRTAPKRAIEIAPDVPVIGLGNPGALTFARDEIIAPNCVSHPGFTSYARGSDGAVYSTRHVEGSNTQMSRSIHNLQVWEHPTDPRRDEIFVPKPLGSAILVFNRTDDGNVKPKRVIQGPATKLEDSEGVTVDDKEIAVPNHNNSILIFPRLGDGNIAPLRQITYQAGTKDPATGAWLGPWGEGSSIELGPAIWFDHKGTGDPGDDEIVVRARYTVRDAAGNRAISQFVIAFFPRNANGPTIPTRIIASKELTGVHQVTVVGDEVLSAVQGNREGNPPVFGGLAVYDAARTSTLNSDGRTLSDVPVKRLLRAGDLQGGLGGVRHPRAVAVDPMRREVYVGDSKGNDIRVFRLDWQNEPCLSEAVAPTPPGRGHEAHGPEDLGHEDHQQARAPSPAVGSPAAPARPNIFGVGIELIDKPKGLDGTPFDLTSIFAFTKDFFHCVVLTNDQAFTMPTHSLGSVEIGKNQFFMSVDSVGIESVRKPAPGRVELRGMARSITRVGDKFEEAIVPFNVVAVDGGPGFERDSLLLTVSYNERDSPMQLAIFGPEAHFGHTILSGDIAIAPN